MTRQVYDHNYEIFISAARIYKTDIFISARNKTNTLVINISEEGKKK